MTGPSAHLPDPTNQAPQVGPGSTWATRAWALGTKLEIEVLPTRVGMPPGGAGLEKGLSVGQAARRGLWSSRARWEQPGKPADRRGVGPLDVGPLPPLQSAASGARVPVCWRR